jgi:hypothetical protein
MVSRALTVALEMWDGRPVDRCTWWPGRGAKGGGRLIRDIVPQQIGLECYHTQKVALTLTSYSAIH